MSTQKSWMRSLILLLLAEVIGAVLFALLGIHNLTWLQASVLSVFDGVMGVAIALSVGLVRWNTPAALGAYPSAHDHVLAMLDYDRADWLTPTGRCDDLDVVGVESADDDEDDEDDDDADDADDEEENAHDTA